MLIVVVVVHLSCRALNEMWKCQNMLRHHVKDLLDLIKTAKSWFFPHSCLVLVIAFLNLLYYMVACLNILEYFFFLFLQSDSHNKAVFSKVMVITSKSLLFLRSAVKLFSCQVQAAFYVVTRNVHWGGTSLHLCVEGKPARPRPDAGLCEEACFRFLRRMRRSESNWRLLWARPARVSRPKSAW